MSTAFDIYLLLSVKEGLIEDIVNTIAATALFADPNVIDLKKWSNAERGSIRLFSDILRIHHKYGMNIAVECIKYALDGRKLVDLRLIGYTWLQAICLPHLYQERFKMHKSLILTKILCAAAGDDAFELVMTPSRSGMSILRIMSECDINTTQEDINYEKERFDIITGIAGKSILYTLPHPCYYYRDKNMTRWLAELKEKCK